MIIRGDEPIYHYKRTQTGVDAYGNPTFTKSSTLIRDALFAYTGTEEPVEENRNPVDATLTLYLPEGTIVGDGDEFDIRGTRWVKDGEPEEWPQLWSGFVPSVVVHVRRRRG